MLELNIVTFHVFVMTFHLPQRYKSWSVCQCFYLCHMLPLDLMEPGVEIPKCPKGLRI